MADSRHFEYANYANHTIEFLSPNPATLSPSTFFVRRIVYEIHAICWRNGAIFTFLTLKWPLKVIQGQRQSRHQIPLVNTCNIVSEHFFRQTHSLRDIYDFLHCSDIADFTSQGCSRKWLCPKCKKISKHRQKFIYSPVHIKSSAIVGNIAP